MNISIKRKECKISHRSKIDLIVPKDGVSRLIFEDGTIIEFEALGKGDLILRQLDNKFETIYCEPMLTGWGGCA